MYILQILGVKLLKWVLNWQHLKKTASSTFFSVGSVVANSSFMVVALIALCIVLALLCSIRIKFGPRRKKTCLRGFRQ